MTLKGDATVVLNRSKDITTDGDSFFFSATCATYSCAFASTQAREG